jgi:hypothetical protein
MREAQERARGCAGSTGKGIPVPIRRGAHFPEEPQRQAF